MTGPGGCGKTWLALRVATLADGSFENGAWLVEPAGQGLRNQAIARQLFIAPGTVKVHLSRIYAKLGITTRAELAAQAAAQNLTATSTDKPIHQVDQPRPGSLWS